MTGSVVAFECDRYGIVLNVIRDDRGVLHGPGVPFVRAVAPHAVSRAFELLEATDRRAAVFDFELQLRDPEGGEQRWVFAAAGSGRHLCIVGADNDLTQAHILDDLMRIDNAHVDALRGALEERARQQQLDVVLGQMMQLNNDMASMQRDLVKKNQQLEQLDQQKNALLGTVAHDLRNPTGIVLGYARVLQDLHPLTPQQRQVVDAIARTADYMSRLVDNLLDLAAIQSGEVHLQLEMVDLTELVRHVTRLFGIIGEPKGITVVEGERAREVTVRADRVKLEQVLSNLVSNAVKFSARGSTVRVDLIRTPRDALIAVTDEGPGIAPDLLERVFEPFQRGDAHSTGGERSTGLGLAIARSIVESHRGRIDVESEVGAGSTFRVVLPLP